VVVPDTARSRPLHEDTVTIVAASHPQERNAHG